MRIVRRENLSAAALVEKQECVKTLLSDLQTEIGLSLASLTLASPRATDSLLRAIQPALLGYKKKVLVFPGLAHGSPQANYTVDFLTTLRETQCGHIHQVTIELCFDNRQAIGTNLLKANMANRLLPNLNGNSAVAVLLVADSKIKAKSYDSSVGDEEEYESALLSAYSAELSTPIVLFTLT
jgi:hypothetical protein